MRGSVGDKVFWKGHTLFKTKSNLSNWRCRVMPPMQAAYIRKKLQSVFPFQPLLVFANAEAECHQQQVDKFE